MNRRTLLITCMVLLLAAYVAGDRATGTKTLARESAATTTKTIAPAQNPADIASIEAYSKGIDRYIKRSPKGARIFGNIASGTENEPDKWREFRNEKEREKADTGDNLNENAYVWLRDGMVVGANFTFQSPSRDWAHYVMYYYRSDGTLAKINAELRTFYGNTIVIRNRLYNPNGKLLQEKTRYLDLQTRKPKKVKEGDFQDMPIELYAKTSDLPFYALVKKGR
jgi:hypothetical protein